jgi:hypothetical protein
MSKIDKVKKFEKVEVHAYVVNFHSSSSGIRPPTNMANPCLESYLHFRLSVRCQRYESISEHNFLKIANFQFHSRALTVSRKITHTNEIL